MYSDDEDDEDLTSYCTIKANEKKSRLFRAQGKSFNSTSRLSLTMCRHISSYQDCLISWLKTWIETVSLCDVERCLSYDWRSCVRRDYESDPVQ